VDALRLQQVLSNLLSNAAKFAPRGTEVTLSWECADEHVRVSVRDLGSGIPLEFHERIFSKFSQADSSDQREQGGTGLGLAISKKLIELMHGRIGFISEPGTGTGTTFWFELPVVASVSQKATTKPHLTNQGQRPRILHVEDDTDVRAVIAAQAASLADFDGAGNLAEARQRLQSHTYQLLMLDIELPDGSGLDLLHEVQNSQPELPVIILSTNEFSDGQLTMAQAAITKSRYSQTELLNLLRQHLQNQQGKPDGKL
jgi:CheY-like chemotaxis protein